MAEQQHPITPPPELVWQWADKQDFPTFEDIATRAARWGADQELEACCANLRMAFGEARADWLRSGRRPKPPSLVEQALAATNAILNDPHRALLIEVRKTLEINRLALERLQELEKGDE